MSEIDGPALRALLADVGPALALYARQWCDAPDDAVQEAFVDLVRLGRWPPNARAWLFRVVRYKAANLDRGKRRHAAHVRRLADTRDAWFVDDPTAEHDADAVRAALEALEPGDREIVVSHLWGGLTFAEVAELVGSSSSAVHRRYRRALDQLATALEPSLTPGQDP